jgi:hypothetical protein
MISILLLFFNHFSICSIFDKFRFHRSFSNASHGEAEETHAAIRAFMAKAVSEEVAEKAPGEVDPLLNRFIIFPRWS